MGEGVRLLLTRPRPQQADWAARLRAQGVEVAALPLMEITPPDSPAPGRAAWQQLPGCALAVFVSPNAVDGFFALAPPGASWPPGPRAACVGPGTARALQARGVPAESIVQPAAGAASLDSEHLWERLCDADWQGAQVLVLRGNGGREWLAEQLGRAGARVQLVSVYQRAEPHWSPAEQAVLDDALARPRQHAWLLSSAESVAQLAARVGPVLQGQRAIATHERIAAAARAAGFEPVVLTRPDPAEVAQALRGL